MSMHIMQMILCRGIVDHTFCTALLETPREALREYHLSADEFRVLAESPARSLVELAEAVEAWRRGDVVAAPAPALALAG